MMTELHDSNDSKTKMKEEDLSISDQAVVWASNAPKYSNWTCYMFGSRPGAGGTAYRPQEGFVPPNRFVRFMTRICFDCYWEKDS